MPLALAAWLILICYLALFFWGSVEARRAAGQPVWLFAHARGRDRLAAIGFRLGFLLALVGPVVTGSTALPTGLQVAGVALAALGMAVAFGAQMAMGASWRVGLRAGEEGPLVTTGPFRISRNPTFLGQFLLLAGVLLASPSAPTLAGLALFAASASVQIRSEERLLRARHGGAYDRWARQVPRWIGLRREERT
ncbi:methyltransferase family protein [Paracoccus versutus]|uniref:methyltransferase family protein n=1 Tax=Paracoccus versutus TaxID=34007 RepID=UPI000DF81C38|nr:isoprenylcysteine carboxylmethyltransferase family protein [Paracoccus versutus]RDD69648.1 isoprenylcysteine carboxylmethyltransferase family protein [Paracoccus versutus]